MNKTTQKDDLKSNKIFAQELKRCEMILDICFTDNIEDKKIIDKSEMDDLKNKEKESNQNNKPNNHH